MAHIISIVPRLKYTAKDTQLASQTAFMKAISLPQVKAWGVMVNL